MPTFVYPFNQTPLPLTSSIGAKARNLMQSKQHGFQVPDGFVLSTSFFQEWNELIKASSEWRNTLADISQTHCEALKYKAHHFAFSSIQQQALQEAIQAINGDLFAVRSSSPEEDLVHSSFAGMYDSFLGVRKQGLEKAITQAYISMLDHRVMSYKQKQNIDLASTDICVIVQKQLHSTVSGVAFSLNPLNNCFDETLINASFGLGESIVQGIVTPDVFVVDKPNGIILTTEIGDKTQEFILDKNGQMQKQKVKNPKTPSLNSEQVLELNTLAKQVEEHYQMPVDIEWAFANDELYLLQVRPITTYIPVFSQMLTEANEPKKLYADVMVTTQGLSECLSVLGLDVFRTMMDAIGKTKSMPEGEDGILLNFHGREYINAGYYAKALGTMAGSQMMIQLVGGISKKEWGQILPSYAPTKPNPLIKQARLGTIKEVLSYIPSGVALLFASAAKKIENFEKQKSTITAFIKSRKNDKPFAQLVQETLSYCPQMNPLVATALLALLAKRKLDKMFKNLGVEKELASLYSNTASNPTAQMGKEMFWLASEPEIIATKDAQEFATKIMNAEYSQALLQKYDTFMHAFGDRTIKEIDIATPRIKNDPKVFFTRLQAIELENNQVQTSEEKKKKAYTHLLQIATKMGKQKAFEKSVNTYEKLSGVREVPKYFIVMSISKLREFALEEGDKLVQAGRLDKKEQMFDLHISQITQAQTDSTLDLRALATTNTVLINKYKHIKHWPALIDSRGKILTTNRTNEKGDFIGQSISNGVVQGRAKILSTPYEKLLLKGEILVTHASEPSWTPIFSNAAGVVLEVGGILQHGAIIAREYAIPCVSALSGITDKIKDGDLIEVDGTNGVVRVIERCEVKCG